ncbi:hypothetical protein CR205_18720 [Alteribacter lacisalsi]|uniref:DUF3784 domain-containing protein n=1 Tax=Alteribacter lacisalsi TaxID=2045244 RepID=A0A2W0H193_9BACI|nr:DUF3784 domain-containing protein [Alteribacter lacisalsi]PYZ95564.1 hypothetical protein CR205_18720 [Alteribacter lacisalsi]
MIAAVYIQLFVFLMIWGGGYLIYKKRMYGLLSGFNTKSEEDQERLIEAGFPQASGRMLMNTSYILLAGAVIALFGWVEEAVLLSWGVWLAVLFGRALFLNRMNKSHTQKLDGFIIIFSAIFVFGGTTALFIAGEAENDIAVTDGQIEVTGWYGSKWTVEDVTSVSLIETPPDTRMRTNGIAYGHRQKGLFRVDELGNGRLYLFRNHPPFLFVQTEDDFFFINSRDEERTQAWYEEIRSMTEK